jgi:hypothetical protein
MPYMWKAEQNWGEYLLDVHCYSKLLRQRRTDSRWRSRKSSWPQTQIIRATGAICPPSDAVSNFLGDFPLICSPLYPGCPSLRQFRIDFRCAVFYSSVIWTRLTLLGWTYTPLWPLVTTRRIDIPEAHTFRYRLLWNRGSLPIFQHLFWSD